MQEVHQDRDDYKINPLQTKSSHRTSTSTQTESYKLLITITFTHLRLLQKMHLHQTRELQQPLPLRLLLQQVSLQRVLLRLAPQLLLPRRLAVQKSFQFCSEPEAMFQI